MKQEVELTINVFVWLKPPSQVQHINLLQDKIHLWPHVLHDIPTKLQHSDA